MSATGFTDANHVLRVARTYIARGWCQGAYVKMADNVNGANVGSSAAARWCALGAIMEAMQSTLMHHVEPIAAKLAVAIDGTLVAYRAGSGTIFMQPSESDADTYGQPVESMVSMWNDSDDRTQEDVLAAFDRAIALP